MTRGRVSRALLALAVGWAGAMVFSEAVQATPEISLKEERGCLVCHTALGKGDLNDMGRHYSAERTLDGYRAPGAPTAEPEGDAPGRDLPNQPEDQRENEREGGRGRARE